MDQPLLALTRRLDASAAPPSPEVTAAENMRQLIQLRWIAVIGQFATILAVHFGLGVPSPSHRCSASSRCSRPPT
jgi:two-component system sensor histidine kinase RegB